MMKICIYSENMTNQSIFWNKYYVFDQQLKLHFFTFNKVSYVKKMHKIPLNVHENYIFSVKYLPV